MAPGVTPIAVDRKDRSAFAKAIADVGVKWDLAVDCIGYSADDARSDVEALSGRASQLVFISTDFVFDSPDRPWKVDETFERFERTIPYGRGKREAELALFDGAAKSKLCATVFRPCHIYGLGSQLGCSPMHGRDVELIDRLRRGETLCLVAGGRLLQQPVFCEDLWTMAISTLGNPRVAGQVYLSPGPDVIESRDYYRIVADTLGVGLSIEEVPMSEHLREKPDDRPHCCHRVYSTDKAKAHGLAVPSTPVAVGLARHVRDILRVRGE
ncbi:MAG: NAD-dependent epimerase/dehydratase family protein [Tepidisphaeraceae bacterium]